MDKVHGLSQEEIVILRNKNQELEQRDAEKSQALDNSNHSLAIISQQVKELQCRNEELHG